MKDSLVFVFPHSRWLADYWLRSDLLRSDLVAGVTLAAYAIPVSLACGT
jgi:MFS superfamily sulfate permease-like transporter